MNDLKSIIRFFTPPVFPGDGEKTRKARYANAIALTFMVIIFGYEVIVPLAIGSFNAGFSDLILGILAIVIFTSWVLLKRGHLQLISILLIVVTWIASNSIAAGGTGIRDTAYILNYSIVAMAALLLGWRASIVVTIASIVSGFGLAYAEKIAIINTVSYPPMPIARDNVFLFGLNILIIYLLVNGLENEIKKSRENLKELKATNINLNEVQVDLEKRTFELSQRGIELESANEQVHRRATQFEALAQVSQSITSIRDLNELLSRVATVISENFGFYHVGLFLLDEIDEFAILIATNSEGGKKMIQRQHRLRVGAEGIVGNVTSTGEPRIALDVGKDAVFFNNPELPNTHSEMALPLLSGKRIIGALDVQSTETGAFTKQDVQTLSLLAGQVSLAIENARLFDESRKALAESEMISRQSTREAWKRLPEQHQLLGYRYNVTGASPLRELVQVEEGVGKNKGKQSETGTIVVPIELRGETIGTLLVQSPSAILTADQHDLIKAVADRVALSAENARLFEETTLRAERERKVSDITSKIRSQNDPQIMIETAINELRNALGATRVEVIPQSIQGSENKKV